MQVKVTITHTVIFEVQEGTPIEYIRTQALEKIDEGYGNEEEQFDGSLEEQVSNLLTSSVVGTAVAESTTTQVGEVK